MRLVHDLHHRAQVAESRNQELSQELARARQALEEWDAESYQDATEDLCEEIEDLTAQIDRLRAENALLRSNLVRVRHRSQVSDYFDNLASEWYKIARKAQQERDDADRDLDQAVEDLKRTADECGRWRNCALQQQTIMWQASQELKPGLVDYWRRRLAEVVKLEPAGAEDPRVDLFVSTLRTILSHEPLLDPSWSTLAEPWREIITLAADLGRRWAEADDLAETVVTGTDWASGRDETHAQAFMPIPDEATGRILSDVFAERDRQDEQWGGPGHDDQHNIMEWASMIRDHLRAATAISGDERRRRLVNVAALALAVISSFDRGGWASV